VGASLTDLEFWASPEPTIARVDTQRVVDQLTRTGHDVRDGDVALLASLGVTASRTPVLWERSAPDDPAHSDLRWAARRLAALRDVGVEPIVTLLHHGSGPTYTDLLDPHFPALFAGYAEAVARAFPWVRRWTPINEPLTTARFSTLYGVWYPNLRDDRAFGRAMLHQTVAQQRAMARIRAVIPDAQLVLTEDLQRFTAADDGVRGYADFLRERMYLSVELLAGRVGPEHPLDAYLRERCGLTRAELDAMRAGATAPDLVAWNHYPHSERYVCTRADDGIGDVPAVYVADEPAPRAAPLLRAAAERLRLPLALGEVHVHAPADERVRWLAQHVEDACTLRAQGVDVRAVGAWAAFGMIDWHSLLCADAGVHEDGVFAFAGPGETPRPTSVAHALTTLARGGTIDAGGVRGWWERPDRSVPLGALLAAAERGEPDGDHRIAAITRPG
jgi:dTDP-4-dehydrorhamnose reductase